MIKHWAFGPILLIILLLLAHPCFSQYIEGKEFAIRGLAMGGLGFILEDSKTAINIYAFDQNSVDLIDYIPGKHLEQITNWMHRGYPYWDVLDPNNNTIRHCATYYFMPGIRYLSKIEDNFALGLVGKSRIASFADVIPEKHSYSLVANQRSGKFLFGNSIGFKLTREMPFPESRFELQDRVALALSYPKFKCGPGIAYRIRSYDYGEFGDYEMHFYLCVNHQGYEGLTMWKYYFDRNPGDSYENKKAWGYDFNNSSRYTMVIKDKKLAIGWILKYRHINEFSHGVRRSSPIINIIPGFSLCSNKLLLGSEQVIVSENDWDRLAFRPKIGVEVRSLQRIYVRCGISFIEEPFSGSILEYEQTVYNFSPIYHYQSETSTYYSFGLVYLVNKTFCIDYFVGLYHTPSQPLKLSFNLSMNYR